MNRLSCIKALIKQKPFKHYLEIGVSNGHILFRVKSNFKIAVDPDFYFDTARRIGKTILNPCNRFNKYFEKTSDDFFEQDASTVFESNKIDIVLVDGMHEWEYALRDVENSLRYLQDNGVIIMHDCNPITKEANCNYNEWKERGFTGIWNGNVWKTIVYLQSQRNDLNVFVLDCDHGLGIITKKKNDHPLVFSLNEIAELTYEDLCKNRQEWLNLKPPTYFIEYFGL